MQSSESLESIFYQICHDVWDWLDERRGASKKNYQEFLISKTKEYTKKPEVTAIDIYPIISGLNYTKVVGYYHNGTVSLQEMEEKRVVKDMPPGALGSVETVVRTKTVDEVKGELRAYAKQFARQVKVGCMR